MPEIEHLTMHLAGLFKIDTVPHGLIHLKSGELAYITRRLDRTRVAVPADVDVDDPEPLRQWLDLKRPHLARAQHAVTEDQRRTVTMDVEGESEAPTIITL